MFKNGLSLQQSPPLIVTIPFFLTAFLFLLMFSILLIFKDINLLDRWLPETIGLVHCFNLGFLVMVMIGALTQMLSVLAGVTIPKVLLTSRIVYILVVMGVIGFSFGMIYSVNWMIQIGSLMVWAGLFIFYIIVIITLKKAISSCTVISFKLSAFSAIVMLVFAGRLAWGWAEFGEFSQFRIPMVELHIAWAFFGMVFILIMGVTYKVIPMFYVTADYSYWLSRFGAKIIFYLLSTWTLIFQTFIFDKYIWLQSLIPFIKMGLSFIVLVFCFETIKCLKYRKRAILDTSILYWKLSIFLFFFGALSYGFLQFFFETNKITLISTAIFGIALLSLITGMLYKIIPFLTWLQLASKNIKSPLTMRELLSDQYARKQFYLHCLVIIFLILSIFFPNFKFLFSSLLFFSLIFTISLIMKTLIMYLNAINYKFLKFKIK